MLRLAAASFVATATLLAQGGPPTFVPKGWLGRIAVEDVPAVLAQLPQTTIGKLLANEEVAAAFATGLARFRTRAARSAALHQALRDLKVELPPWYTLRPVTDAAWDALRTLELADLQRVEFGAILREGEDVPRFSREATLGVLQSRPRGEGRTTAAFERLAKDIVAGGMWRSEPDAKLDGFPAHLFEPTEAAANDNVDPDVRAMYGEQRPWMVRLPGTFVFGTATPAECGAFAPAPARAPAQLLGEFDITSYVRLMTGFGAPVPDEVTATGIPALRAVRWRWQFAGADVLDEIEVEVGEAPTGLVKAVLLGKSALPAQPLPEPALAQVRVAVDVAQVVESLPALDADLPAPVTTALAKALTGGIALGACAPAPGGMIPRIYLSLGIADGKALDELLAMLSTHGATTKEVTYEETPCTVLAIAGAPAGLQPTWCRIDGTLHVAESPLSMRAFLKARAAGGEAMAIGDLPVPAGAGEVLPTLDVRTDQAAIYRAFHATWLPLLKLLPLEGMEPLLRSDEMPSPDAVVPLLGKSRGVLRREGNTFRLQQVGPVGGLLACGLAITWGPLLSGPFHADHMDEHLTQQVADKKLGTFHEAFAAFEAAHKRRPADLGELFSANKTLPDDLLCLPGDDRAEPVALPAGDARTIKSSFRYFKDGVKVDAEGESKSMLLIAIAPRRYYRAMLADDGSRPQVWGPECQKPIDQFGK